MPTAMFDLVREGKFVVVRIATKPRWVKAGGKQQRMWTVDAPLPLELAAFCTDRKTPGSDFPEGHPWRGQGYVSVWLDLPKDQSGVDATPMLVAADWLRERGWTIEAHGWCKAELERRVAV